MANVRLYTVDELCNETRKIIIRSQDGVEIGIEPTENGTEIYFYFGNEVVKRDFDYLVKPVKS